MFARTQSDGTWLGAGYVPGAADWQDLSTKVFQGVNGTRGGAWAPSAALTFASGNFVVTGPAVVAYGGELQINAIEIADDTWPQLGDDHALRTRTIVQSMLRRESSPREHWKADRATAGIQSLCLGIQPTDRSRVSSPARFRVGLEVQDGGTLASVVFAFSVPTKRSAAPVTMPKFRIVRASLDGNTTVLASSAIGADADGWQSPAKATSADAWYASGLAQTFTYVCDQNNAIDVSRYSYWAEVVEEGVDLSPVAPALLDGIILREQKADVDFASTQNVVALSGFSTVDGSTVATGERVLIKDQSDPSQNGIYIVNTGGAWARASDLDELVDFTKGFFVYVKAGFQNKGTVWQIAAPYPTKFPGASSDGGAATVRFAPFVATGNKFLSMALRFVDIAEIRWQ